MVRGYLQDVRGIVFVVSLSACKACGSYMYTSMNMITENKFLFSVNAEQLASVKC